MKTVFLFPGQGAQAPGMAKDLWESSEKVRNYFDIASGIAGKDLKSLIFEGTEDDLKSTDNTQIAMTLANMSAAIVLQEHGIKADVVAGFSIGEYSALWAAGILSAEDVFKLVLKRGQAMEQCSRAYDSPEGSAGMTAVIGLTREQIVELFAANGLKDVYVANHNSPTQIVLAGTHAGLAAAEKVCTDAEAMKVVRLKVSGPFHSPLLAKARKSFEAELGACTWQDPKIPLISNVTAQAIDKGSSARSLAGEQIVSAVRWVDTMNYLIDQKVERILEVGPGKVLCGLWRATTRETKCQPAGTLEMIKELLKTP
jgi:[acyl-carrier-protein] S-malonyltransferase